MKIILYSVACDGFNIYGPAKWALFDDETIAKKVADMLNAKELNEKRDNKKGFTWLKTLYFTTAKSGRWDGEGGQKIALENALKNGMHKAFIEKATEKERAEALAEVMAEAEAEEV